MLKNSLLKTQDIEMRVKTITLLMKTLMLVLTLSVVLSGCGQYGPLYLPNNPEVEKPQ